MELVFEPRQQQIGMRVRRSPLARARGRLELGLKLYYQSPWVRAPYRSAAVPVIIGGCDRSGTTLLRAALDSHPALAAGPESWLFAYRVSSQFLADEFRMPLDEVCRLRSESIGLAEFIDRFFGVVADRAGAPRWCEKSPRNVMRLDYIWEHFPEARVVHIIRDGRDVAVSLRRHPRRVRTPAGYAPTDIDRPVGACIDHWRRHVAAGLRHRGDDRYLEVRYEDLVRDYESTLRRVCRHADLEWDEAVLAREQIQQARADRELVNPEVREPLLATPIGRWRRELTRTELGVVHERGGALLAELGYLDAPPDADDAFGLTPTRGGFGLTAR